MRPKLFKAGVRGLRVYRRRAPPRPEEEIFDRARSHPQQPRHAGRQAARVVEEARTN